MAAIEKLAVRIRPDIPGRLRMIWRIERTRKGMGALIDHACALLRSLRSASDFTSSIED